MSCTHISYRAVQAPDGETIYEANCSGRRATFADCMNQAAKACQGKYKILDKDRQQGMVGAGVKGNSFVTTTEAKQMMFQCVAADPVPELVGPPAYDPYVP